METDIEEYKSILEFLGEEFNEEAEKKYEESILHFKQAKHIKKCAQTDWDKFHENGGLKSGKLSSEMAFRVAYSMGYRQSMKDEKEAHNSMVEFLNDNTV